MTGPATFRLWAAFGTEAFAASLDAGDTPWIDITDYVFEAQFATSTRATRFDTFAAGYGRFTLDNNTRLFDPAYAAGTYYGDFKRHVPIRVTAEHSSTRYTVWRGWARSWQTNYEGRYRSTATVAATDALGVLASYELDKVATGGDGDELVDRFGTVTGLVGFPAALTDTSALGQTGPFQATELGENALRHITTLATAEGGLVYADRDGVLTLDARVAPALVTRQITSQQSFDDTSEPAYDGLTLASVGENYRDIVRVSGVSGVVQEVDSSATDSAPVVFQKLNTDLADDFAASSAATFFADLYSIEQPHPNTMSVTVATKDSDLRTAVLPRRLRDRIDVTYSPPGGGADITADCFIDGIEHDVTPARWRTRYTLSSADAFDSLTGPPSAWLVVGDATKGKVATGVVAY